MQTQTPPKSEQRMSLLCDLAAAATTMGAVLDFKGGDRLRIGGQLTLAPAFVLMATGVESSRGNMIAVYALLALSITLLLTRVFNFAVWRLNLRHRVEI